MSAILGCINARAQELLKLHLASGITKLIFWFKGKLKGSHAALAEEGKDLVTRALINATAFRKILKKYDKETVFDPFFLTCGHILCYMCSCSNASVTVVDGLKAADPTKKCPSCRREGVYEGAVQLEELNMLLSRSCEDYWEERLRTERKERLKQVKEHWDLQCRSFVGV